MQEMRWVKELMRTRVRKPTWHFHRQLYDRYGIVMKHGEFSEMMADIRTGRAELIERKSQAGSIYAILLAQHWKTIFVAVRKGRVVTAMPPTPDLMRRWRRLYRGP